MTVSTRPPQQILIEQVYGKRLKYYEELDVRSRSRTELLDLGREASSLLQVLEDFESEGYGHLITDVVGSVEAPQRLSHFITCLCDRLGASSPRELFYLHSVPLVQHEPGRAPERRLWKLADFLTELEDRAAKPWSVRRCFPSRDEAQLWEEQTRAKVDELMRFLAWIIDYVKRRPNGVPVFLLRDTLLPFLGFRWLRQAGFDLPEPQPMLMNRAYLEGHGACEASYLELSGLVSQAQLQEGIDIDLPALRRAFETVLPSHSGMPHHLTHSIHDYLDRLLNGRPPLFVESGLTGTFPLWLLSFCRQGGDLLMFTSVPWLHGVYGPSLFSRNYNHLRALETLLVNEHLFQFHSTDEDDVMIEESLDESIRALAGWELHEVRNAAMRWAHGGKA